MGNDRGMQDCFREHPEIYGSELEEDEDSPRDEAAPGLDPAEGSLPAAAMSATPEPHSPPSSSLTGLSTTSEEGTSDTERARAAKQQVERDHGDAASESDEMVPKAAHNASRYALSGK